MKHESVKGAYEGDINVYLNYSDNRLKEFKRLPLDNSDFVIHISNWRGIPFDKEQWVSIWYGNQQTVMSSKVIHELSKKLKALATNKGTKSSIVDLNTLPYDEQERILQTRYGKELSTNKGNTDEAQEDD